MEQVQVVAVQEPEEEEETVKQQKSK